MQQRDYRPKGHIMIGGEQITVPYGYIQAEMKYTEKESTIFYKSTKSDSDSNIRKYRQAVLEKRIEFYEMFKNGKVKLDEIPLNVSDPSVIDKIINRITK